MRLLPLFVLLALAACEKPPTAAERAADDAKAVAMVEAANRRYAPPQALAPQPIKTADLQKHALLDAGCAFVTEDRDPVLLLRPKRAFMKLGRELTSYASDPGSAELPLGTWTHYVGKAGSLRIAKTGEADGTAQNQLAWRATVTATDDHDRIVYTSSGTLRCGA